MAFRVAPSDEVGGTPELAHQGGPGQSQLTASPDADGSALETLEELEELEALEAFGDDDSARSSVRASVRASVRSSVRRTVRSSVRRVTDATSSSSAKRPHWLRELILMGGIYFAYSMVRNLAPNQAAEAQRNARSILDAEKVIGLDVEKSLNHLVSDMSWLALPAIYYYATLHIILTVAVVVWLYRRRPAQYVLARGVLLVMTAIALAGYWLYPLAPPRLMTGGGYVDTAVKYELWGYTPSEAVETLSNQYAAMPSMHFGWALWVGVVLALLARTRAVRVFGVLYPLLTLAVIVVTANHFVLDAVVALVIFLVSPFIVQALSMLRRRVAEPSDA